MSGKITISDNSTKDSYLQLYELPVGTVFKITGNYETVMRRIEEFTPDGILFEVFPITPGTDLYTIYGCDHLVVTENKNVNG